MKSMILLLGMLGFQQTGILKNYDEIKRNEEQISQKNKELVELNKLRQAVRDKIHAPSTSESDRHVLQGTSKGYLASMLQAFEEVNLLKAQRARLLARNTVRKIQFAPELYDLKDFQNMFRVDPKNGKLLKSILSRYEKTRKQEQQSPVDLETLEQEYLQTAHVIQNIRKQLLEDIKFELTSGGFGDLDTDIDFSFED